MALERQRVLVPMTSGHDQTIDDRVAPAVTLLSLVNCEWLERGAVRQRRGWEAFSHHVIGDGSPDTGGMPGSPRILFSTGTELCAVRTNDLLAYDTAQDGWRVRAGCVSPWGLERRSVFRDEFNFGNCDSIASESGLVIHVATSFSSDGSGTFNGGVVAVATNADGSVRASGGPYDVADSTGANGGHDPRCAYSGNDVLEVHEIGATSLVGTKLRMVSNSGGAMVDQGVIATDLSGLVIPGSPAHDCVGVPTSAGVATTWVLAYQKYDAGASNQYTIVQSRKDVAGGGALLGTTTIASQALSVSLYAYGKYIYVMTHDIAGGASNIVLRRYPLNTDGTWAAIDVGPVTLGAIAAGSVVVGMGLVVGSIGGAFRIVAAWSTRDANSVGVTVTGTFTTAGVAVDSARAIRNTCMVTRPWVHDGRAFLGVCNIMHGDRSLETAYAVLDVIAGSASAPERNPLVGSFSHIGQAYSWHALADAGLDSAFGTAVQPASVWADADGAYHFDVTAWGSLTIGSDEVRLTYAPTIGAVSVYRGTAVIGGALVSWYDGMRAFELGTPVGFGTVVTDAVVGGGGLAGTSVSYQVASESRDMAGVIHRGLPGPGNPLPALAIVGPKNAANVRIHYLSLTNRAEAGAFGDQMSIALYKADANGGYAKYARAGELHANKLYDAALNSFVIQDTGFTTAGDTSLIYTSAGEVEDVAPEGGRFPAIVAQRLHLAQGAATPLVAFSKRFYALASGVRYAPELNADVYGFVLPEDDRAIAVAALDDKTVIFSTGHTYLQSGQGPDDLGQGSDYGPLQLISADVGCVDARSVCSTPVGVFFQGDAGIYLLGRDLTIQSIGEAVRDMLALYPTVTSATLVASSYQVRFTLAGATHGSGGTVLVYDYRLGTWARWELNDYLGNAVRFVSGCLHGGRHYLLSEDGAIVRESETDYRDTWVVPFGGAGWIAQTIGLGWIQVAGQSGWQRAWGWIPLLEQLGAFGLTCELSSDFNATPDNTITIDPATIATYPELPRVQPYVEVRRQECQAASFRITTTDPGLTAAPSASAKGFSCAGITFEVGAKSGKVKTSVQQRS